MDDLDNTNQDFEAELNNLGAKIKFFRFHQNIEPKDLGSANFSETEFK